MDRETAYKVLGKMMGAYPYDGLTNSVNAIEAAEITLDDYQRTLDRRARLVTNAMWMLLAIVVACFAMCCTPSTKATVNEPELHSSKPRTVDEQDESAVKIENACVSGDAFAGAAALRVDGAQGSGVVIATGIVLTAAHVVRCDGAQILHIVKKNGTKLEASLAVFDASRDYARLKVPGLASVSSAILGRAAVGDEVCIAHAHPFRGRACGTLTKREWKTLVNGTVDLWTSARTVPGNSGSGIYNARGELIGLATNNIGCVVDPWRDDCGGLATSLMDRVR